jgi:hypothetical protein
VADYAHELAQDFGIRTVRRDKLKHILVWLVLPTTLCLAITRQSLWVDEGFTVWFASHKSIASFFSGLMGSPGAPGDPQMLFYLLYMWGWIKLFGTSEVALRAANVPFALLLMGAMSWASRHLLRQPSIWVLFCLSPFLWFYLNEARPYVALMAFSTVAIVALLAYLIHTSDYKLFAPWCCLFALLLAWGTHILGVFLFPSMMVLAAATAIGDPAVRRTFVHDWSRPILFSSPAFVALGGFYAWVSAYGVNMGHGKPGLLNLVYVFYEFVGFGGLGPPRGEIRKTPHLYVFAPYWPWLLVGVIALAVVAFFLVRTRPPGIVWSLTASMLVGAAIALKISMIEHFQVLGRHMAVFFPMLLLTLMLWSRRSLSAPQGRGSAVAALFAICIAWGISDARMIFRHEYEKDAYRDAASMAVASVELNGGKILWAADPHTAHYYGIQVMRGKSSAEIGKNDGLDWPVRIRAIDAENWTLNEAAVYLADRTEPATLVLSKTDLFDTKGAWRALIEQQKPTEGGYNHRSKCPPTFKLAVVNGRASFDVTVRSGAPSDADGVEKIS